MATKLLPATAGAATGNGPAIQIKGTDTAFNYRTFQAVGQVSTGTGSATMLIQASNDGVNFLTVGTITLSLTTTTTNDGIAIAAAWEWYRVNYNIPANGTVTVYMKA